MAFVTLPGIKGKVYVPDDNPARPKKHACKDCFSCQMCSDDRCNLCRRHEMRPPGYACRKQSGRRCCSAQTT